MKKKKKERKNIEEERRRRGKKRVERGRKKKKDRECSVVYGKVVGPCMGKENNKKKVKNIILIKKDIL